MTKKQIQEKLKEIQENKSLLNLSNHNTLKDYVIVVGTTVKSDGISVDTNQYEDRATMGLVVSAGSESDAQTGDVVMFGQYSHTTMSLDGVDYLVLRKEDIISIIKQK